MQRAAIGCHERSKGAKLLAGAPDALKGACPVRVGAGMKPTAERQQGASFDLHRSPSPLLKHYPCTEVAFQTLRAHELLKGALLLGS